MATTSRLTEADCQNVRWTVVKTTSTYRLSIGKGTHPTTGLPITVERCEFLADEELQARNAEERAIRDARPWSYGMGSDKGGNMPMVHVASIPLNKWLADAAPHIQQGDKDHMRWLLNSEAYEPFRTRSGRV